jgi:hypothetical protein
MSVTQSHSTNIKQGQEAARGSGMLARISKRDLRAFADTIDSVVSPSVDRGILRYCAIGVF